MFKKRNKSFTESEKKCENEREDYFILFFGSIRSNLDDTSGDEFVDLFAHNRIAQMCIRCLWIFHVVYHLKVRKQIEILTKAKLTQNLVANKIRKSIFFFSVKTNSYLLVALLDLRESHYNQITKKNSIKIFIKKRFDKPNFRILFF